MIPASSREKEIPVFLLFADISGYTQYVKLHSKAWAHGQFVISELIKSLIREIEPAYREIQFSNPLSFVAGQEVCEGIGEIKTYVHFPKPHGRGAAAHVPQVSWVDKAIGAAKKMAFTWFSANTK